jgi:WD40 repeat protein
MRCWIKCHGMPIQYLSWRPHDFQPDTPAVHRWFASASNDATAKVYDLAPLYEPEFMTDPKSNYLRRISSDCSLNGHGGLRVISLAWSPHNDNLILTTSYDRTAVVSRNSLPLGRTYGTIFILCIFTNYIRFGIFKTRLGWLGTQGISTASCLLSSIQWILSKLSRAVMS